VGGGIEGSVGASLNTSLASRNTLSSIHPGNGGFGVLLGVLRSTHGSTRRLPRQILGPPVGRDARRGPWFLQHRLPRYLRLGPAMLQKNTAHRLSLLWVQARPAETVSKDDAVVSRRGRPRPPPPPGLSTSRPPPPLPLRPRRLLRPAAGLGLERRDDRRIRACYQAKEHGRECGGGGRRIQA